MGKNFAVENFTGYIYRDNPQQPSLHLTPCRGLEVKNPTKTLMSISDLQRICLKNYVSCIGWDWKNRFGGVRQHCHHKMQRKKPTQRTDITQSKESNLYTKDTDKVYLYE